MKHNESMVDRVIRAILGVALVYIGFTLGGVTGIVLYVVAAVLFVTAAVGFCPLYVLLHIDTCKMSKSCAG